MPSKPKSTKPKSKATKTESEPDPANVVHVKTNAELQALIKSQKVVLVDFYADWCGPCQNVGEAIVRLVAPKLINKPFTCAKVDADLPDFQALCVAEKIDSIPVLMIYVNGERISFPVIEEDADGERKKVTTNRYEGWDYGLPNVLVHQLTALCDEGAKRS